VRSLHRRAVAVLAAALALATVGCGSSSPGPGGSSGSQVRAVTSTNVYADLVSQIGGDHVSVTAFISNPDADPHSYEASAQNLLALSKASLVIENGGGYDDFMTTMYRAGHSKAKVLNAVDLSGDSAAPGGEPNEHVWYDFSAMDTLIGHIAAALSDSAPADKAAFTANASALRARIGTLKATEAAIRSRYAGRGVAITEPVPLYLLQACGLVNRTSQAFSKAVEEDGDVSPRVLADTLALFNDKQVSLLAYNEQTTGATTARVLAAAKANSIPVVPVTETLPSGKNYVSWMADTLSAVQTALTP
jgi:zinc/manganese transport system substrate-binding protein